MPISFDCTCGTNLSVSDELAGRTAKCPACGATMRIPGGGPQTRPGIPPPIPRPRTTTAMPRPAATPGRAQTQVNPFGFDAPPKPAAPRPAAGPSPVIADEPLRLKETPPAVPEADPLALQVTQGSELAQQNARATRTVNAPPPKLFLDKASQEFSFYDYRHFLLMLALVPLLISLFSKEDNVEERMQQTLAHASPEVQKRIAELELDPDAKVNDLFALLPGHRIEGAHLERESWAHWVYAALSAAAFMAAILYLFPQGNAEMPDLIKVGLFTGTIGIIFLLVVQWIAAFSGAIGVRMVGKATIILLVIQFIGFSYRCALDPSNGFLLSFVGFTCGVGLCEELCKGWPILRHFTTKAKLDWKGACAWGLASGVGFGVSEGIMYSSDFYNGITGMEIYVIRFVSCVALHAIWGASVGIGMFRRQITYQGGLSIYEMALPVVLVLSVPMIMHGLYDTLLKKESPGWAFFVAAISFLFLAWQIEQMKREEQSEPSPNMPIMA